jgi:outer membrane autotransporter protein
LLHFSLRTHRLTLLASVFGLIAAPAFAASFTVTSGTDTTAKFVLNNDIGTISTGATLSAATAITWQGGTVGTGVVINNSGTVSATTRAIDADGGMGAIFQGSFTLNNNAGARLISSGNDAFRVNSNLGPSSTLTVNNAGLLVSGSVNSNNALIAGASGQALDFAAINGSAGTVVIINGGTIGASGDDAIRTGGGTTRITNSGLIEAVGNFRGVYLNNALSNVTAFTLTNTATGMIRSQDDTLRITGAVTGNPASLITVDNSGTIQATGGGQAIDFNDIGSTTLTLSNTTIITNRAGGLIQSSTADALRPGNRSTINNSGTIRVVSTAPNASSEGIDYQDFWSGTVNNLAGGLIEGARHGITGKQDLTITNELGGSIIGRNGSGIGSDGRGNVANRGLIRGDIDGAAGSGSTNGDGDGVDIDGIGSITNFGTIMGTGAKGVGSDTRPNGSDGIAMGGGTITNYAGALISGANNGILIDDSSAGNALGATTLTNAGTIQGLSGFGIRFIGTHADSITNSGIITATGSNAAIDMGGGNDTLSLAAGSAITGLIDGGAGTDTVNLGGNGMLSNIANFEILALNSGTWTLTGTQTYTTASIASGGTLANNGTLNGALTVAAGGRVQGAGTISNLTVNGIVAPGNSIGTMNVGSITLASGSSYQVEINAAGAADRITATDTATIQSGATVSVLPEAGSYGATTSYTILSATGGVTGTFSSVTSSLGYLTPSLSYGAKAVTLTLTRNANFLGQQAITTNQIAVAGALDRAPTTNDLFLAAVPLTGATARAAFDTLSGEIHASAAAGLLSGMGTARNLVLGRLAQVPPSGFWFQGLGSWRSADGKGNAGDTEQMLGGAAVGFDAVVNDALWVGASLAYRAGDIEAMARASEADLSGIDAMFYGAYMPGDFVLRGGLGIGRYGITSQRNVTFPAAQTINANYNALSWQAFAEASYPIAMENMAIEPLVRLIHQLLRTEGFTEAGGIAALTGASQTSILNTALLGARFSATWDSVVPSLLLGWRYGGGDLAPASLMTLQSTGTQFAVTGTPLARDAVVADAGLAFLLGNGGRLRVGYLGQFGGGENDHSFNATLSWGW